MAPGWDECAGPNWSARWLVRLNYNRLMRSLTVLALAAALSLAIAQPLAAAEKTLDGTLVCAKCFLNKPDAKDCQDVLLVPEAGKTVEYYVTKNKVAEDSGESCTLEIKATVTGEISEKDGRLWITPSRIVKK
jgi:hypothetical protein